MSKELDLTLGWRVEVEESEARPGMWLFRLIPPDEWQYRQTRKEAEKAGERALTAATDMLNTLAGGPSKAELVEAESNIEGLENEANESRAEIRSLKNRAGMVGSLALTLRWSVQTMKIANDVGALAEDGIESYYDAEAVLAAYDAAGGTG